MAVRQPASTGLSNQDVEAVRAELAAGRRPKVVFAPSAGQMAGQTGQVTRLDDPTTGEWIVVRFGKDELPFSPTDLSRPVRPVPARRRTSAPQPAPAQQTADQPSAEPAGSRNAGGAPTRSASAGAAREKPRGAGRGTKPRPPSELTVTLAWRDGGWTVQASRGAKVVAKPASVQSADALRMVGMLEVPAVQRLVEQIAAAERAVAEEQAERLRRQVAEAEAQLAEAEARLASLHDLDSSSIAS